MDLIVSSHLDDAVLSCGGRIASASRKGRQVVVVTVFAAPAPLNPTSLLARQYHRLMGFDDPQLRRREDMAALARLGARAVHLDHLDCIYRRRDDGAPLVVHEQDIFRSEIAAEAGLLLAIEHDLAATASRCRPRRLLAPLAAGGHRDHVFARRAAEATAEAIGPALELVYYEDVPYVIAEPRCAIETSHGMVEEIYHLSEEELQDRLDAVRQYRSQRQVLWHDGTSLLPSIASFARHLGGGTPAERYWRGSSTRAR